MKKDRNSFFSQFGSYGYNSMPQPMMPQANMGNYQMQQPTQSYALESDIDSRLSRIERELNRLDARISKLESTTIISQNSNNTDYNFANSMYMV